MPKEVKSDGELRFEGFASYPNSCAFDPNKGLLEFSQNMEIFDGVITPRKGSVLAGTASGQIQYACTAASTNGDGILLWGPNQRFDCQTGTFSTPAQSLANKAQTRGQGYQNAIAYESSVADFDAGGNICERLVTAKGDKLQFTLYTGNQPYEPDSAYLVQGTYDAIQAVDVGVNQIIAFGKRSVYSINAGMGRQANPKRLPQDGVLHKIELLSDTIGIVGKDAMAYCGDMLTFMDQEGIRTFDERGNLSEGKSLVSDQIKDIIDLIDPSKLSQVCAVGIKDKAYYALPLLAPYNKTVVLAMSASNGSLFESLNVYPYSIDILCVARKDGIPRLWGINKSLGRVYLLDEGTTDAGTAIQGKIRSRNYFLNTHAEKRYEACSLHLATNGNAQVDFNFISVNPDGNWTIDTFDGNLGTTVRRALANKKCMGGKLEVVIKSGRPSIYSIGVDLSIVGRSIFSAF